jgi:DNA-binding MarR family transcriptional regulator
MSAQRRSPAPLASADGAAAAVSRDEVFETSRLVVELLHAAHASRRAPAVEGHGADPAGASETPASDHAIRAAIHLYQHGDRTVGQLATGLGISRGWASRVADELVERGRAEREADPDDRRVVRLRLTERALAEIEQAYRWRGDVVAAALDGLDPSGRDAVRRFLREVAAGLAAREAPGG